MSPVEKIVVQNEDRRAKVKTSKNVSEENIVNPTVMNFLGWGGGMFFFIYAGLTAFVAYGSRSITDGLAALIYAVCGFLLFPPGRKTLEKATGKPWSQKKLLRAYFLLASMGFVLTFISMKTNAPENAVSVSPAEVTPAYLAPAKQDFYWGYIGTDGLFKIKPAYDTATAFCMGRARVQSNGKWKVIDPAGAVVSTTVETSECGDAFEHRLYRPAFDSLTGKYGFLDTSGTWVVPPQFDRVGNFQSIQR